jgi:YHS domain-containing protein
MISTTRLVRQPNKLRRQLQPIEEVTMSTALYFLIWGALIFFMMRFGCGAHVMGHGHSHGEHSGGQRDRSPSAVDPVCGMTVEAWGAPSSMYRGGAYYFCSQECRGKFDAAPENYVNRSMSSQPSEVGHHGSH